MPPSTCSSLSPERQPTIIRACTKDPVTVTDPTAPDSADIPDTGPAHPGSAAGSDVTVVDVTTPEGAPADNGAPPAVATAAEPDAAPAEPTGAILGLVDGSEEASSQRFQVVLADDAVGRLDDIVASSSTLADGTEVSHYGIVVEATGRIEGAEVPSDTARISRDHTMPGVLSRRVEVQLLRTVPEMWVHAQPGAVVRKAVGVDREQALFLDKMGDGRLGAGLDASGLPVYLDFSFFSGEKGGHVSISGVSGVATKTSYATFLLYMLFETDQGRQLLGDQGPNTKALIFNVKGEDLLNLDRPNASYAKHPEASEQWAALGVAAPGPFSDVGVYCPPTHASGQVKTSVESRDKSATTAYGWSPWEFIRQGLLKFCFTDGDESHISFIEERVRLQLARWAYKHATIDGAVVLRAPADPRIVPMHFERVVATGREPVAPNQDDDFVVKDFDDLVEFLALRCDASNPDGEWTAGVAVGTLGAFMRRLYAQARRVGSLVSCGLTAPGLDHQLNVVDIHSLHDSAQRFVVGALVTAQFEAKQGSGRLPLRIVVLDELNKYAPRVGTSPIKEVLVDIAARGRSLGVLLLGAQQAATDVDANITRNASIKVVGRLDAGEASEYRFLSPELRERAARFQPGTMVLDQPLVPAPIPLRFPFPNYATCVAEAGEDPVAKAAAEDDAMGRL